LSVPASPAPIGILAGRDGLPLEVAEAVLARGRGVFLVGIAGETDPAIARYPHRWVAWGQIGRLLRAFREAGCRELVIIGGVRRPDLRALRPDASLLRHLPLLLRLMRGGDDTVLRRVAQFFQRAGFTVRGAHEVAPELLAGAGTLAGRAPTPAEAADIAAGLHVIAVLGTADVGQAAVISGGRAVAMEAAEGTDAMLERLARAKHSLSEAGGVLVKAPKPGQELRVDLPTIGPRTVERAAAAGLGAIAVAAGRVLIAERRRVVELAAAHGLALVGIEAGSRQAAESPEPATAGIAIHTLGRVMPGSDQLRDARTALVVARKAVRFGSSGAAAVARGHVLAVAGAGESLDSVIARSAGLRQWGDQGSRRRRGILAVRDPGMDPAELVPAVARAGLSGIVWDSVAADPGRTIALVKEADSLRLAVLAPARQRPEPGHSGRPVSVFLVAGEHSGDALGGKLMAALRDALGGRVRFAGVGGEQMAAEGLASLFPLSDVAVMGPLSILPRLPRIVARVQEAARAGLAADPDVVVIIDSPEFSHPIARRIRQRRPDIPIIDYVSPQVWAWRPGRARRMRTYLDHILALLPFEPAALERLGGPPCTYVGHPLIERLEALRALDPAPLAERLKLDPGRPVLVVLPGSRSSEVGRLMGPFGATVAALEREGLSPQIIIPAVSHVRGQIEAALAGWPRRPHVTEGEEDKFRAFKLARAALAASGTVTLELALAGTPAAVAYRVDPLAARLRFLVKVPSIVLANLVLGENVYPEFIQEDCAPDKLAAALAPLLTDSPERARQLAGLARIADRMRLPAGTPSEKAAEIVLRYAFGGRS
jgi:lipid-A-disaccharide synthase